MIRENSLKNLIPTNKRSNVTELGRIGGKKSGEIRRKKREMREVICSLLSLPTPFSKIREKMSEMGFDKKDMTNQLHMILAVYRRAIKGDVSAATFLRDTAGEKPVEKQELSGCVPVIISGENELE